MSLYQRKERVLNWFVSHLPAILQILFMERVLRIVKESSRKEAAREVLFTEKEGRLRAGRQHQPSAPVRTTQLDLLGMQESYQQIPSFSELLRSDSRAYRAAMQGRNAHMGQRGPRTRTLQLRKG